ncbi:hypothetical protein FOCG_17291 [Fusarium oxysporum f. sp. radicis-lycopersici 26381]|nr:hypothetical protein FOCG_17291 [Fusarium oxysporum f. sp. radicis-lycopersici 26381]
MVGAKKLKYYGNMHLNLYMNHISPPKAPGMKPNLAGT